MNSLYNEHPSRKITQDFIIMSIATAQKNYSGTALDIYKMMLEMCVDRSMLDFQQMMTVFQILHWNGSFKAMRERECTRDEVISYYCNKYFNIRL